MAMKVDNPVRPDVAGPKPPIPMPVEPAVLKGPSLGSYRRNRPERRYPSGDWFR